MRYIWWRHQMEAFSALLAICAGNSPGPGEFPAQRPVTRSFDVFFDLRLNKRLSKHSWGWWFETPSYTRFTFCCFFISSSGLLLVSRNQIYQSHSDGPTLRYMVEQFIWIPHKLWYSLNKTKRGREREREKIEIILNWFKKKSNAL